MGRRRSNGRPVNGIVLLDKPVGITSNAALQQVKHLFNARKAGHTGSLDPRASGMLPICLGEATKISAFLLDADKRYLAVCQLGVRTRTGDADGEVLETRPVGEISAARLHEVIERFTGDIEQIPPMHSAIKRQGVPLYKLAHQGLEVEREPRQITIHSLKVVAFSGDRLTLDVHCSKGTYVRTLAEDIGEALGCGAHLAALERTAVAGFRAEQMLTMEALREQAGQGHAALDALLLPIESALLNWPDVRLTEDAVFYMRQGQAVFVPHSPVGGLVRLYSAKERFLGVGQVLDDGRIAPRRLVNSA